MKLFLVSPQDTSQEQAEKFIKQHFEGRYIALEGHRSPLWIVAAPVDTTPAQVSEKLNMFENEEDQEHVSGVVLQIADFHGFDRKSLWQQLDVWLNE